MCYSPQGRKELDMTEPLNNNHHLTPERVIKAEFVRLEC